MKTVSDILRDADPVLHERRVPDDTRGRVRQIVLAAAPENMPAPVARIRVWGVVLAVVVAGLVAMVAAKTWLGGSATLEAAVRLEVRLAETEPAAGLREARIADSDRVLYLHPETIVTNDDISDARIVQRPDTPWFDVAIVFNAAGGEKMRQATSAHPGQPLAILIDGEVVAAPTIRATISTEARITGKFTKAEAGRIARGMIIR